MVKATKVAGKGYHTCPVRVIGWPIDDVAEFHQFADALVVGGEGPNTRKTHQVFAAELKKAFWLVDGVALTWIKS